MKFAGKCVLTVLAFVVLMPAMLFQGAEESFGKPSFESDDGPRGIFSETLEGIWGKP